MIASPRFSATIRLVSRTEFDRHARPSVPSADPPWTLEQMVAGEPEALSVGACVCTIGGVQGETTGGKRKFLLFHLIPYHVRENRVIIRERLKEEIRKLHRIGQDQQKFLPGLLLGGDINSHSSREAFDILRNIFCKYQVQPSILWGQTYASCDAYYNANQDLWLVHATDRQGQEILDRQSLHQGFRTVEIAPGDTLEIASEK